jgi:hypothetical protein
LLILEECFLSLFIILFFWFSRSQELDFSRCFFFVFFCCWWFVLFLLFACLLHLQFDSVICWSLEGKKTSLEQLILLQYFLLVVERRKRKTKKNLNWKIYDEGKGRKVWMGQLRRKKKRQKMKENLCLQKQAKITKLTTKLGVSNRLIFHRCWKFNIIYYWTLRQFSNKDIKFVVMFGFSNSLFFSSFYCKISSR